jgi:PAS domain S-box-containing protein
MSLLAIVWSMAAAACFTLGFLHFIIWLQHRSDISHIIFTLATFGAAANTIIEIFLLHTDSTGTAMLLMKIAHIPIFFLLIALVWFVKAYFRFANLGLALIITTMWSIALVYNFVPPNSLPYIEITEMQQIILPWGEHFYQALGRTNPWKYIADIADLLIIIFLIDATVRLWRTGERRRALIVGGSVTFFIVAIGIYTPLADEGIIAAPPIISLSFVAILFAMGSQYTSEVIRASVLSQEVRANERRWRTLLENVDLLVVGMDPQGIVNYVNPCYLKLTGFSEQEVLGKSFSNVVPNTGQELPSESLTSPGEEYIQPHYQNTILTKAGQKRIITWSTVGLYNRENLYVGILSIGVDITEREESYREIQQLKDRLQEENIYLQEEIILDHNYRDIIGRSDVLKYALSRVTQVAPTDTTVLLEGETGVGKELFARAVHQASPRRQRPLVRVNCAAIPVNLIESELFGHVKGAYTGADKDRKGRFELANKGTILLDEISELPLEVQSKLLRVLEEGEFERLGNNQTIRVDVRIIAATNRDLKKEAQKGTFREDLYYRLHAYPISIPPLRKRRDDILPLVEFFVDKFSRKMGKRIEKIPKDIQEMLLNYDWPGNVRELRNVIERAVIATPGNKLVLPETLHSPESVGFAEEEEIEIIPLEEVERRHIIKALEATGGTISGEEGAAVLLKLHPNTLRFRIQKLGIKKTVL